MADKSMEKAVEELRFPAGGLPELREAVMKEYHDWVLPIFVPYLEELEKEGGACHEHVYKRYQEWFITVQYV